MALVVVIHGSFRALVNAGVVVEHQIVAFALLAVVSALTLLAALHTFGTQARFSVQKLPIVAV